MLFRSFAHWILLLFVFVSLALGIVLGMWFGFWGSDIKAWTHDAAAPWIARYSANEATVVFAVKVLGAIGTVVTGIWGIHRAWYYAELSLPKRLNEFIERVGNRDIVGNRDNYLKAAQSVLASSSEADGFFTEWQRSRARQRFQSLAEGVLSSEREVDGTLALLETAKTSWRKQKATVHYVRGFAAVCDAEKLTRRHEASLTDIRSHRRRALDEFTSADNFDSEDLRALDLAATRAEELDDYDAAMEKWEKYGTGADKQGDTPRYASAMYRFAVNCEKKSQDPNLKRGKRADLWGYARDSLEKARDRLGQSPKTVDRDYQLAKICELLGRIRTELRTFPSAKGALTSARELFAGLNATADVQRVDSLLGYIAEKNVALAEEATFEQNNGAGNIDLALGLAFEKLGLAQLANGRNGSGRQALNAAREIFLDLNPPDDEGVRRIDVQLEEAARAT